jgi:tRNA (guanine-N7-)-methyltransferase
VLTDKYLNIIQQRREGLRRDLAPLFPGPAERIFTWEVGCGHGHYLTDYAAAHPGELCVGIDLLADRIERANRKRDRAGRPNLQFLQAEARLFLSELPAPARIGRLLLLFPDPWPKLRHHKHRILQPDFLSAVAERAALDCRFYFRTDFAPYLEEGRAALAAHPRWAVVDEPWPFERETVFQSRAPTFGSCVARLRPAGH